MKYSEILTPFCRILAVGSLSFMLMGCQGGSAPVTHSTPDQVGNYTGQQLPDKVEKLVGTPFYSTAKEFTPLTKLSGASYLVIAPQSPTSAVLVVEKMSKPEEVAARPSALTEFSGQTSTVDAPDLPKYVKDHYELDLNVGADGKVTILELSDVPKASATPAPAEAEKGE